ncbi:hypothetical protein AIOL_004383 [Candidatus Rhodobacter oscarellae]|uniref:ChrR-like cupin domain-containing protein n=2 Tax=Candidatus Rhodobacter oscarellae TaxID=1675527 RepID=A0A0J9E9U5_9RHOB|nr:hypothetical protein AIOL_004383 [Candidatus Rhodobacter lobularis]
MHLGTEIFEAAFKTSDTHLPGTRPDLAADTQLMAEQFAPLLKSFPEAEPPKGLFDAIEAELDGLEAEPTQSLRADEGEWVQRSDKVWKKVLATDEVSGRSTYLLRCLPGASIKPHLHERAEHIFVVEGELWMNGKQFLAGDAQISPPLSEHAEITMPNGCLVLVSV